MELRDPVTDRSGTLKHSWNKALGRARRPFNSVLRNSLVAGLVTPHTVDDYLELVAPMWSVREVRARIAEIRLERPDAVSLFLLPNENWQGFRAGQFVQLSVRIAGICHTRCFSLSSAPADQTPLRITLKLIPDGRISSWARQGARVRDLVRLSQAMGDFVLPRPIPPKLLFISGGSGITPIVSMIRQLAAIGHSAEIACLHYAPDAALFQEELALLSRRHLALRLAVHRTRPRYGQRADAHFSLEQLENFAPAWRECETFLCGPSPLMQAVTDLWQVHGLRQRLHLEHFASALPGRARGDAPYTEYEIAFARSRRAIYGSSDRSLLEQAELSGLHPAHGCRMGICQTCTCRKLSGITRNELTGQLSTQPDEEIQLCVSTPRTDVTLDL
jgi:stearoyl-CoA 9-desaturase NADPH oxidoreductase